MYCKVEDYIFLLINQHTQIISMVIRSYEQVLSRHRESSDASERDIRNKVDCLRHSDIFGELPIHSMST